jgi:SAM-dependent methyltransferase
MYHQLWADWYLPAAMPALEQLFFSRVPVEARVLDLCCGSGHVTQELVRRGYQTTGVDNSTGLIEIARRDLPDTDLRVADARELPFADEFQAVLSTFDSLNHILDLNSLERAFECVHRALKTGGLFVFDMNLEEAYSADLREWAVDIQETTVGLVRGRFSHISKRASTELIWFVRDAERACWQQRRSTVEQQCYTQAEILTALGKAGFREIESVLAPVVGVSADLGFGRMYFTARKLC